MSTRAERAEPSPRPGTRPNTGAYHFMIQAEADASTLSRVLEIFAQRDLIPDEVTCKRTNGDELHIHMAISRLPADKAANLADRIRNIIPVMRVVLEPAPSDGLQMAVP